MTPKSRHSAPGQTAETQHWCSAVINTPELLECILLQLDLQTLLTSVQLVSRLWRQSIQDSNPLQRALFLLPAEADQGADGTHDEQAKRQYNPLLERWFPAWFHKELSGDPATDMPWSSNGSLAVFLRPEASWRRMLVCQPPAYTLGTVQVSSIQWSYSKTVRVRKVNAGVRMDHLLDICVGWLEPAFQVNWGEHMQELDNRWRRFAQEIWPEVERAMREAHIVVFLSCAAGCVDEEEEVASGPYEDIVKFAERFKPSTPYSDEGGWDKVHEGLWD